MLSHKHLVREIPHRRCRRHHEPEEDRASDQPLLRDVVGSDLRLDVIVSRPLGQEESHVDERGEEEATGYPAVDPFETLVAYAREETDDVAFSGEEDDEGSCEGC